MTHYFFDVMAKGSVEHDYKGLYFSSFDEAQQMAEWISIDLSCTRLDGSSVMEVQIRTAAGTLLASVPVKLIDALAA
jgi:hypothetical protein